MNQTLILKAAHFAAMKHRDQRRKDHASSPYINHPIAVALLLAETGQVEDPEVIAAALLHDTIEDTDTRPEELEATFGARVRGIVEEVTDDKSLMKVERKRRQIEHASQLTSGAALVKLGDKISNVTDITNSPPAGWDLIRRREYLDWADAVISNCPKVNQALENRFAKALEEGRVKLGELD
ncbi:MAG: HD domain-containing protein [Methylococcaceae bacterium]|nr:HD domain-containing protein [Methylococcaceae bacterium]MCI0733650.1 HD domain-containing protein [Methylococcaceae bacterium]